MTPEPAGLPMSWLLLYEADNTCTSLIPEEASRIDAAVSGWIDSGKSRDELLHLTLREGGTFCTLASSIRSWWICTPEHRRKALEYEKQLKDESREMKAAIGLPWSEDD